MCCQPDLLPFPDVQPVSVPGDPGSRRESFLIIYLWEDQSLKGWEKKKKKRQEQMKPNLLHFLLKFELTLQLKFEIFQIHAVVDKKKLK